MANGEILGGVGLELPGRTIPKERRLIKNPEAVREHNLKALIKEVGGDEPLAKIMREHVRKGEKEDYYSVMGTVVSIMTEPKTSDLLEEVMRLEAKGWLREEYGIKAEELMPEELEGMICGKIPLLTAVGTRKRLQNTLVGRSLRIVRHLFQTGEVDSFRANPKGVYEKMIGKEEGAGEEK